MSRADIIGTVFVAVSAMILFATLMTNPRRAKWEDPVEQRRRRLSVHGHQLCPRCGNFTAFDKKCEVCGWTENAADCT